jgi:hypothetical protein
LKQIQFRRSRTRAAERDKAIYGPISWSLAVESQEVVPVEARAADRWSMVEATMRTLPVVVVKPGKKILVAVLRVLIQAGVHPFPQGGLNEAFGFAVGARGIGASEVMAQTKFNHGSVKSAGTVAMTATSSMRLSLCR